MRRMLRILVCGMALMLAMPAAIAQETTVPTQLSVTTPFVGVSIKPGDTATFALDVAGPPGTRVALSVDDVPENWETSLSGGGFQLSEVLIGETGHVSVDLDVDVPEDATEGDYGVTVVSSSGGVVQRLPLALSVTATAGGEVSLSTDFPDLQGSADSTFSYTLDLSNGTPQEIQFGLTAEGPEGWQVEVRPSGEAQASTVTVGGGQNTTVTVDVDPPDTAEAGSYVVVARADGGGESAEVELGVTITGSFDVELATASEVLNVDVNAGSSSTLDLVVVNSGSAPLVGVTMSATPPSGWNVTFDTEVIESIPAGESVPVIATITPADGAINGDYVVSFDARTTEASAGIDIRATVKTSAAWGLVGVAVIGLALVGLALVFRRYGRR